MHVSVLRLLTFLVRGIRHNFVSFILHPLRMAPRLTVIFVFVASYMLTSSSSKIVMYLASAILLVLSNDAVVIPGTTLTVLAGLRSSC